MIEFMISVFLFGFILGILLKATKKVIYRPFITNYVDGFPTFYIIKETSYFSFSFDYELIGRDRFGLEPFYSAEEMEERVKYLNLK